MPGAAPITSNHGFGVVDLTPITSNHHFEAVDLIAGTTIVSVFYTLVVILYCFSGKLSYSQLRNYTGGKLQRQTVITFALASVMMICATMDVALTNLQRRITFVDYGTLPNGPLGLAASLHATTVIKLELVTRLVEKFIIIGVMMWRVLVVWNGTPLIKPVTLLLYVTNAGLAITDLIMQWPGSAQLVTTIAAPWIEHRMFLASTIFTTALLMIMTIMLVVRLLYARQQLVQVMGKNESADTYLSVAAILVESYALETTWNILFCIFCSLKMVPVKNFFSATVTQVDILTNLLVIYRVVSGRAWDRETQGRISTMRWSQHDPSDDTVGTMNP